MDIGPSTTLAAAVDAHPALTRHFERLGLDYCCSGGRTIEEACRHRGLDTVDVLADLARHEVSPDPAEWTSMDAVSLVEHLERTHHRYLWDELPRVTALLEKIVGVHGERHPELLGISACFAELRADLQPHLMKEERVLFPMIRELAASGASDEAPAFHCGTLRNPISVMLSEHDRAGHLLAELRRRTDDYTPPADGCATYAACFVAMREIEADTHLHIHKENNVLFPLVVRMEAERSAASARV